MFFWNSLDFLMIQWMLAVWFLVPLPFLNPAWTPGSSRFTYYWSLAWRILSITLLACEMSATVWSDQIRSVAQSCPALCDPMNPSTPGLPVPHQLPFTQTHVHRWRHRNRNYPHETQRQRLTTCPQCSDLGGVKWPHTEGARVPKAEKRNRKNTWRNNDQKCAKFGQNYKSLK